MKTLGGEGGPAFRDRELEERLLAAARANGVGAQFGGSHFRNIVDTPQA